MPTRTLYDLFLDTVKPPAARRVDYFDTEETGLVFRVAPSGRRTWCFRYRPAGSRRMQRLTLGTYPTLSRRRPAARRSRCSGRGGPGGGSRLAKGRLARTSRPSGS